MNRQFIILLTFSFISINLFSQTVTDKKLATLSNLNTLYDESKSNTKKGTFDFKGVTNLFIMIDAGMEITLTGSDTESLTYEYEFEGNEEAYNHFFENFDPEFIDNGGEARLVIDFPKQTGKRVNHKTETHSLQISLPEDVVVQLQTRYSKVKASDFVQGISITNRSGRVSIQNSKQVVSVNNEYGDVVLIGIEGEIMVSNRSATVDVRDISGNVSMSTEYSKMNISKIEGTVDISNRSGTLNAFDITGDMRLSGAYMKYELTNIDGDIMMSNKSGNVILDGSHSFSLSGEYTHVEASNISGVKGVEISGKSATITLKNISEDTFIDGQYLKIDLQKIGGKARINNKSAAIQIDDLAEDLTIEGEYMPVTVKNFKGANLQIVNRSNNISVEALNDLKFLMIESEYGNVNLNLKKKYSGFIEVETRYGTFDSSLSIDSQQISKSDNELIISGKVGNGDGRMIIKTRNADVKVNQD
ncbi:MAG: DUF4097 family beta strand repeat-containing protein [Balneola sp.]